MAARGVDAYLDWYFSLGAEWSRFITLLTGDVDLLLQAKFSQMVMSSPEIAEHLSVVQRSYEAQWEHLVGARSRALDLLSRNRLILDESQCKVIEEFSMTQVTAQWDTSQARLVSGSGAGLVAGVLAAKVTTKAMSKTAMKTAGVALTKAAAKKGVGKALATATGAVIGTLAAPGLGTAAGAVIGAGAGVAVGVGIDLVALMAEEGLTRDDMRKQLLNAVSESLQPYRDSLTCSAFSGGLGVRPR